MGLVVLRGVRRRDEVAEHVHEAVRLVVEREVSRIGEQLEAAPGHGRVRRAPVVGGNERVPLAPDDQRGHALGEVQAVRGAHALAAGVHDRPGRVQERALALSAPQRRDAVPHPLEVAARAQAEDAQRPTDDEPRGPHQRGAEQERQDEVGARQRRRAQQQAHLAPEPAAVDQHQALDALRELVAQLHRDPAAHRVADDGRGGDVEGDHDVAQPAGERAERVVAARLGRRAVPEQVGRDHRVVLGQLREDLAPRPQARRDAVDEQQRRARARHRVLDLVPVEAQALRRDRHYGIFRPEIARAITRRWISEVPSKIV